MFNEAFLPGQKRNCSSPSGWERVATLFQLGGSHRIKWSCSAVDSADSGLNTASKYPCSSYDLDLAQPLKSSGSNDWGPFQEAANNSLVEELAKHNFMSFHFSTYWSSVSKLHQISLIFDFLWSHQEFPSAVYLQIKITYEKKAFVCSL